jgi:hypothetical protein
MTRLAGVKLQNEEPAVNCKPRVRDAVEPSDHRQFVKHQGTT